MIPKLNVNLEMILIAVKHRQLAVIKWIATNYGPLKQELLVQETVLNEAIKAGALETLLWIQTFINTSQSP
jgi:hypothetical protein